MQINLENIFLIQKKNLAFGFFCAGILWAYWGSLMPWFMWGTVKFNAIIPSFFIIISFYISYYFTSENIFDREHYESSALLALIALVLMRIVNLNNIIGFAEATLTAFIIFTLLKLNTDYLQKLTKVICISMGGFLILSVGSFILYLLGFPLPSSPIANEELLYSYQNYYLFLVDDRAFFAFIPRFHSVFLEPGHLGTATAFLLLTQIGQWKKWYNIVLIITTMITFSLAAYVLFILVMFASAWIQHKKVIMKVLGIFILITGVGIGAFFYQQGDNMLFTLIIERMEMTEDGDIEGNNRVTEDFDAIYDDFVKSPDILVGREYKIEDFGFGNSGYKVFLYDYGIICLLCVFLFYLITAVNGNNRRAFISALLIGCAAFMVRSTPFSFYFLLPLYSTSYILESKTQNDEK